MSSYVFISNSNKPTEEQRQSRENIKLSNVNRPCLKTALDLGYKVFFGVNRSNAEELECELPVIMYDSHTYRSITNIRDNLIAYRNLKDVLKNNDIEVIHCNTPIGGMIGRLIGKRYKINKVIYTAHGFHFYKGAPLLNRTIFKLAEKIMARWTDVIITMNEEDYQAAKKFKLKNNGKVFKVHGVGINLDDYFKTYVDFNMKRKELGFDEDNIICISAGDLVKRKNYASSIKAIADSNDKNIHYLICGKGPEKDNLQRLARELNVEDRIHFLGFRKDIKELMKISDIFLFTTLQEGLPRSMMEAMASGLPCIASNIRGNVDLIDNEKGGFLIDSSDIKNISEKINFLAADKNLRKSMGSFNLKDIQNYDISYVENEIRDIYNEVLEKNK